MNKENNNHEIDYSEKQFYRNPLDPDVTEGQAIGYTIKTCVKILFLYITPAILILYALYYFIGW